jgi:hypothetical protein
MPSSSSKSMTSDNSRYQRGRPRPALPIAAWGGDKRERSFAGIADLAEMRLHAACNAPIDGVGAEMLDVRMALFCYPRGPRKPCRAAQGEFADVRLYARMNASLARRYARA